MSITTEELLKKALDYNGIVVVLVWASSFIALLKDKMPSEHFVTICAAILAQGWLTKINTKGT